MKTFKTAILAVCVLAGMPLFQGCVALLLVGGATYGAVRITVGTFDSSANRLGAQQIYDAMKAGF